METNQNSESGIDYTQESVHMESHHNSPGAKQGTGLIGQGSPMSLEMKENRTVHGGHKILVEQNLGPQYAQHGTLESIPGSPYQRTDVIGEPNQNTAYTTPGHETLGNCLKMTYPQGGIHVDRNQLYLQNSFPVQTDQVQLENTALPSQINLTSVDYSKLAHVQTVATPFLSMQNRVGVLPPVNEMMNPTLLASAGLATSVIRPLLGVGTGMLPSQIQVTQPNDGKVLPNQVYTFSSEISAMETNAAMAMAAMSSIQTEPRLEIPPNSELQRTESINVMSKENQSNTDDEARMQGKGYHQYGEDADNGQHSDSETVTPTTPIKTLAERKIYPNDIQADQGSMSEVFNLEPTNSAERGGKSDSQCDANPSTESNHASLNNNDAGNSLTVIQDSGKKKRKIQDYWFKIFPWLELDTNEMLFFCKYCKKCKVTGVFVQGKPADNPKKDFFSKHEVTTEHKSSETEYFRQDNNETNNDVTVVEPPAIEDTIRPKVIGYNLRHLVDKMNKDLVSNEDDNLKQTLIKGHHFAVFPWLCLDTETNTFFCQLCHSDREESSYIVKGTLHPKMTLFNEHEDSCTHKHLLEEMSTNQAGNHEESGELKEIVLLCIGKYMTERKKRKSHLPQKLNPADEARFKEDLEAVKHSKEGTNLRRSARNTRNILPRWFVEFSWLELDFSNRIFCCKLCKKYKTGGQFCEGKSITNPKKDKFLKHETTEVHKLAVLKESCEGIPDADLENLSEEELRDLANKCSQEQVSDMKSEVEKAKRGRPKSSQVTKSEEKVEKSPCDDIKTEKVQNSKAKTHRNVGIKVNPNWLVEHPWLMFDKSKAKYICQLCLVYNTSDKPPLESVDAGKTKEHFLAHEQSAEHLKALDSAQGTGDDPPENTPSMDIEKARPSESVTVGDLNVNSTGTWTSKFWPLASEMRALGILCDVALTAADQATNEIHQFQLHKIILVCASEYFKGLLRDGTIENTFHCEGVSPEGLEGVIKFMYGEIAEGSNDYYIECYKAAEALMLYDAKRFFGDLADVDENKSQDFESPMVASPVNDPSDDDNDSDFVLKDDEVNSVEMEELKEESRPTHSKESKKKTKTTGTAQEKKKILSNVLPTCNICGVKFLKFSLLKRHKTCKHGHNNSQQKKEFKCPICNKVYASMYKVKEHQRTHTDERPFLCTICGKNFAKKCVLSEHMKRHQPESKREHKCPHCGKLFIKAADMERHIIGIHSGEKPFQCQHCGKAFPWRRSLSDHLKKHEMTLPRPYECDQCKMNFVRKYDLNRHQVTHSKYKPFICEWCGAKFTQKGSMDKHKRENCRQRPGSETVSKKANKKKQTNTRSNRKIECLSSKKEVVPIDIQPRPDQSAIAVEIANPMLPLDYTHNARRSPDHQTQTPRENQSPKSENGSGIIQPTAHPTHIQEHFPNFQYSLPHFPHSFGEGMAPVNHPQTTEVPVSIQNEFMLYQNLAGQTGWTFPTNLQNQ